VIGDLSLKVRPGERIGIVGRSGAGKSTLVNLLLRFHDIEGGRITIDGLRCATGEPAPRDRRRHPGHGPVAPLDPRQRRLWAAGGERSRDHRRPRATTSTRPAGAASTPMPASAARSSPAASVSVSPSRKA
jgi:ABC-type glutathione transport system ATPase component